MAEQSDAEDALVTLAATALYPDGPDAASIIAATTRIYRGWPTASALDADLAAGTVNVTVFPVPGGTRNTTRYPAIWHATPATPTLTVSVAGYTTTFAGSADPGQLAGILVEGQSYVHETGANETPSLVAAILAASIAPTRPATANGTSVSLPGARSVVARTVAGATAYREVRRQQQSFRVTAWCPTPTLRDAACGAIDDLFAATPFLTLADGSAARLRFTNTTTFDQSQDAALYRRDLVYSVEFPTMQTASQPAMLFGTVATGAVTITV